MNEHLETDYLIVGAGAAGMAFADELLTHSDATVTIVDRRHAPGGHWVDAYPFVRLHQPSTFYGLSSLPLGHDTIDATGVNAGFYEQAGADEIRAYYSRAMAQRFLPSGRVRYFPNCDYVGQNRFVSRVSDASWEVKVRRKLVDATYLEGKVPATSPPPFEVADGVRCVPAGGITRLDGDVERYVIIGAGKTAMDVGIWLLERHVPPHRIQWIRPREAWWLNRRFQQPYSMVPELYRGGALQLEAMASGASVDEIFAQLERDGYFLRIDRDVPATMFRGAITSETEIQRLRQIEDVVRMGHVRRIERDQIVLDEGNVPTDGRTVHVHCASRALARRPLRPIFEPDRITVQAFAWAFACYQYAALAVVEATVADDEEKNRLCPPISYWDESRDYLVAFLSGMVFDRARMNHPALATWAKSTRLNPTSSVAEYREDPRVVEARDRIRQVAAAAATNLQKVLALRT